MKAICTISGYEVTGIFSHWEPFKSLRTFEVEIDESELDDGVIKLTKGPNPIYLDFTEEDIVYFEDDVVEITSDEAWSRTNY